MHQLKTIFLIICYIYLCSSLQINHKQKTLKVHKKQHQSRQSVTEALKYYRTDSVIQSQLDKIAKDSADYFQKLTCGNDDNYKYVIIENKTDNSNEKKQIVITCNIHARQILVTEVCLDFISAISDVVNNKQTAKINNMQKRNQFDKNSIENLLKNSVITIFYRGNDQRDKIISGPNYCIRKDKNNIDLNRNFPTNFNLQNFARNSQQYPGDKPLSQSFSTCLDRYLQKINQTSKTNIFIDIHTGQFTLFDSYTSKSKEQYNTTQILNKLKERYCPECRITSLGDKEDDEMTNGQIFPDIKKRYNAEHSVLLQIYGGYNDHLSDNENCIAIFNPLTQPQLNYYKDLWKNALLYFIKLSLNTYRQK